MSVAAPPRPPAPGAARGPRDAANEAVVNPFPMRYPQASSPAFMGRRAWWLVAMNFVVPGSAQVLAGNKRLGRFGLASTMILWGIVAVMILLGLLLPQVALTILTNPFTLFIAQLLMLAYGLLWIVLTFDTIRLVRLVRLGNGVRLAVGIVAVLGMVLSGGGAIAAATYVATTRDTLGSIFGAGAAAVPPSDGYYNILLLGADSGEGRDSMRFDSISVVSVNADSGAVTITGIPRDMPNFPFSEGPMSELYPNGFEGHADPSCGWSSGVNQLMNAVEVCRDGSEIYPKATVLGSSPAIEATKDAAEGILGIEIPYYVFVDMHGFADLVDALGGVEITVAERLPKGGGPSYEGQSAEEWASGWIEPGTQVMDGDTAQWYARSRYTTSDFDRMKRQRELQTAILAQFTPATVLTRFQELAAAGTALIETDLPQSMLPYFAELAVKSREEPQTAIELTPEGGVDEFEPDFAAIHDMIAASLHPPTPTEAP